MDTNGNAFTHSKATAPIEILVFIAADFLISRLRLWPIPAINGFFSSALGSSWNYGFLAYKIAMILLVLLVFRRRLLPAIVGRGKNISAIPFGLACAGIAMAPTGLGLLFGAAVFKPLDPAVVFDILLFQLVNDSAEELTFRGYFLERIDEASRNRWDLFGIPVGPGLFTAGLLFGLVHALNPFNPFGGSWTVAPLWGLTTLGSGLMFGLVRLASGSMVPAILLHALPDILNACTKDAGQEGVLPYLTMTAAYGCVFILCLIMARRRMRPST